MKFLPQNGETNLNLLISLVKSRKNSMNTMKNLNQKKYDSKVISLRYHKVGVCSGKEHAACSRKHPDSSRDATN